MSRTTKAIARARVNAAIFEVLETRQLMSQTAALEPQHTPEVAPSASEARQRITKELEPQAASSASRGLRVPISQVPELNSRPGAFRKIYLDFNGNGAFSWTNSEKTWNVTGTPAFTIDGNANDFNEFERTAIENLHSWVAEKFSPFNVNVTTVDPGNTNHGETIKVIIGGASTDWYKPNKGGVAAIGGFLDANLGNECFVFSASSIAGGTGALAAGDLRFVGETIAHEVGHTFGLEHQRHNLGMGAVDTYYDGTATESPIMGDSGNNASARGVWWKTNTYGQNSPDAVADELNFLTSTFPDEGPLPFATDDIPSNVTPSITLMNNGALAPVSGFDQSTRVNSGTLERATDQDTWRFIASTNQGTFHVLPWAQGGMLSLNATLLNSSGQVVPSTIAANGNGVTIETTSLSAGSAYFLRVSSKGGYGDIGQYRFTGNMAPLATYDSATKTLSVSGVSGINNNMRLYMSYGGPVAQVVVQNNFGSQAFDADIIWNINVDLGNGDDVLQIEQLKSAPNGYSLPVSVNLGGGTNTLKVKAYNTINPFNVASTWVQWDTMSVPYQGVQRLELLGFNGATDRFNILEMGLNTAVHAYGYAGDDVMEISPSLVRNTGMHTYFHGGPGVDTLKVDGAIAGNMTPASMDIIDDYVSVNAAGYPREFHFDTEVEALSLTGGDAREVFGIYELQPSITNLDINLGKGDDSVWIGLSDDYAPSYSTPFSDSVKGAINVIGGEGTDGIYVDDRFATTSPGYSLSDTRFRILGGGSVGYAADVESLTVDGRTTGAAVYNIFGTSPNTRTVLNAGAQSDAFNIYQSAGAATMNGGAGGDYFYISNGGQLGTLSAATLIDGGTGEGDYASFNDVNSPYAVTHQTLNDSRFELMGYRNLDGIGITLGPGNDYLYVRSTAQGTPVTVDGMNGDDTLLLGRSYFVAGEQPTLDGIRSRINFNGGAGTDKVNLTDSSTTVDSEWTFTQGKIERKDKAAGGGRNSPRVPLEIVYDYNTLESLTLEAGAGNDKIVAPQVSAVATFKGGAGADQFEIPSLILATSVTIDGEAGFDGLSLNTIVSGDCVITENRITHNGWYWPLVANYAGLEGIVATGSWNYANTFYVQSTASGTPIQLHGGAADDTFVIGNNNLANEIRSVVYVNGAGGTNSLIINDHADTTNNYVTIDQNYIGGYQGDSLFGPGGYVQTPGINTILNLGAGNDTIVAQPNAVGSLALSGGGGTNTLKLGLATTTNPVINTFNGNGSVTSSNRRAVTFWNFGAVQSDNVAPAVVSSSYNYNVPAGQKPSLTFRFSEDVSRQLSVAYLDLKNVHTNQPIPAGNVALSYDLATNTATFTFPGYANGVLPDGFYAARIHTSLTDAFGNTMAVDQTLNFNVLAGDANRDGKVDVADLGIVASNWQKTGRTFSQGDFNYDGKVDVADLGIVASKWQSSSPAPSLPFASSGSSSPSRSVDRPAKQLGLI